MPGEEEREGRGYEPVEIQVEVPSIKVVIKDPELAALVRAGLKLLSKLGKIVFEESEEGTE